MGDLLAQVALGGLLHLAKDHGRNLLGSELLLGTIDLDLNDGSAIPVDDLVGEVLEIVLEILLVELAANKTPKQLAAVWIVIGSRSILDVVDGVGGVSGGLVLGGVTDETLVLGKGDV